MFDDNCYYGNGYYNGMAMGIFLIGAIIAFPVFPLVCGGWFIGEEIIGNNFAKWGLAAISFFGGYYILKQLIQKGYLYVVSFVFIEYLIADVILTTNNNRAELYMVGIVKAIIAWGASNT